MCCTWRFENCNSFFLFEKKILSIFSNCDERKIIILNPKKKKKKVLTIQKQCITCTQCCNSNTSNCLVWESGDVLFFLLTRLWMINGLSYLWEYPAEWAFVPFPKDNGPSLFFYCYTKASKPKAHRSLLEIYFILIFIFKNNEKEIN